MADETGMVDARERAERARRRKAARARAEKDEIGKRPEKEKAGGGRKGPETGAVPPEDEPGAAFRRAQRNLKYGHAEAAEWCLREAAAMTAGKQDDRRAASVEEIQDILNHDPSATLGDMDKFAESYMAGAVQAAMGE